MLQHLFYKLELEVHLHVIIWLNEILLQLHLILADGNHYPAKLTETVGCAFIHTAWIKLLA